MKTPEYHVSAGLFGGIYAGTLMPKKEGKPQMWRNKSDVTDEAIRAVRDQMVSECLDVDCPYIGNVLCIREICYDALAYIQQLERERDAAVADLRVARHCRTCEGFNHEPSDQPCLSCGVGGKNYKWRGVKDTRTGASDSCTGASGV